MTQNDQIAKFLQNGNTLNSAQARKKFGVRRLAARIQELRAEGLPIYTNKKADITTYRLGRPTKRMVALAFALGGSSIFNER